MGRTKSEITKEISKECQKGSHAHLISESLQNQGVSLLSELCREKHARDSASITHTLKSLTVFWGAYHLEKLVARINLINNLEIAIIEGEITSEQALLILLKEDPGGTSDRDAFKYMIIEKFFGIVAIDDAEVKIIVECMIEYLDMICDKGLEMSSI